jgi:hypothetical protein
MSLSLINIGNVVNDGLGDDLRTAFEKVNSNFREIDETILSSGLNLGNGARLFKRKDASTFEFRTLVAGRDIGVTQLEDVVEIRSTAENSFKSITTNSGILNASSSEHFTLRGGSTIDVVYDNAFSIVVDNVKIGEQTFTDILTSFDFGPISGSYNNAVQFVIANSNTDFGSITTPSSINLDAGEIEVQGLL